MSSKTSKAEWIPLVVVLMIWGFVAWFSCVRYQPVPVIPAAAGENLFSAERADLFLNRLFADSNPRPAGSNDNFRERVVKEFQELGYEVELQRSTTEAANWRYEGNGSLALTNIVVTSPEPATHSAMENNVPQIIVAGHFDSHPKSPGVSDDGVSIVICLEIARMLRRRPIPGLMFVLTDGEEFGMLGARDFVKKTPFPEKPIVINIEARGTSGPSLMFETSADSSWLVDLFARTAQRPLASSLFYEVYRFLPNDTDFTVYKEAGWRGMNFAFIGQVKNYHTPGDNLQNLDRGSLQHHGENVWGVLNELARTDLGSVSTDSAVYFDMFGLGIVRWPGKWSLWLALAATGMGVLVFFGMSPPSASGIATALFGLGCLISILVASLATGLLVQYGLTIDGALDVLFPPSAPMIELTFWLWPLVAMTGCVWLFSNRTGLCTILSIVWGMWSALAIVTSHFVAGCSYLFIAPLLLMVLVLLVARWTVARHNSDRFAAIAATSGAIAAGVIWLPMERLFFDAVGFSLNTALMVRATMLLTSLLPVIFLLSRPRQLVFLASAITGAAFVTVLAVAFN